MAASPQKFVLKKEDTQKVKDLLKSIEDDPNAQPFLNPVDWQELGLHDYPTIVKTPMDFSTLRKNLAKGKY